MKHINTFEGFLNESKKAECVYMAPKGRASLQKYDKKIATILSDDGDSITIKFPDGKTLSEVPKEQVRFLGESINTPVNEAVSQLIVFPSSKADHQKISNWLPKSDWHADEEKNYFSFEVSGRKDADATEAELEKEFAKLGADVRYELQESFDSLKESKISEIFLMANYAKSFAQFKKEFMDEFGKPATPKEISQIEEWLQTIWKNREPATN